MAKFVYLSFKVLHKNEFVKAALHAESTLIHQTAADL